MLCFTVQRGKTCDGSLIRLAKMVKRKNYLQNNFFLIIWLTISAFLHRRDATNSETQLARVREIAVKGRFVDQVIADLDELGLTCTDISDVQAGKTHNVSKIFLCQKEFRERSSLFPTLLSVSLLIDEDNTLISFEHSVHRLCL